MKNKEISNQHKFIKNDPKQPRAYATTLQEVEIIDLQGNKRQGFLYEINAFIPHFSTIFKRIIITTDSGNHEKHVPFTWDYNNQIYKEITN